MRQFFLRAYAPGIILTLAAVTALIWANTPWADDYQRLIGWQLTLGSGLFGITHALYDWINEGLMATFFFLVGLEIKREILAGQLSSIRSLSLPLAAAAGGMIVPALIYAAVNAHDPTALRGWAIPAATDIAFALGVLSLLGTRVPSSLKILLTAIAIIDDLGAILIIAIFYTDDLSLPMLTAAAGCIGVLILLNRVRVGRILPYVLVGVVLWVCVLKSGVHATLAGVATALAVPMIPDKDSPPQSATLLDRVEHGLKPWVDFLVLPIFALANAGLSFAGLSLSSLTHPISLGIALGLVGGKTVGIFAAARAMIGVGWSDMPPGSLHRQLLGVACLCGIGFTMSLFIGALAFGDAGEFPNRVKLGVIGGSLIAAVVGSWILRTAAPARVAILALLAAGVISLGASAVSVAAADQTPDAAPGLPSEVMRTLAAQHLPASAVSVLVMDPETGHTLAGYNIATPRSPASTVKVLTTFASLDMLGPAYTWHTRALLRGDLANGVLDGDLILQGGGDPFMTIERWWAFARSLRSRGLKTIRGDIVIDDSAYLLANEDPAAFDGRPHRNYNVLPDALMINFQSIEFHLTPDPSSHQVLIQADPAPVNLVIDNQVRYSSGRCSGAARRVDFEVTSERWDHASFKGVLSQHCEPRSFTRVMLRPADYAFGTFVALWRELGGEFGGKMRDEPAAADARLYLSFDSLTLGEIVRLTNKYSSNLMARHLLLTLGQERYGLPATTQKGAMAIADWSKARGLSLQDVDIDNGSGLSRTTHVTVAEMANVLNAAFHSRYAPEFLTSLPLAGIDGTLRSRLRDTPAGAARLKTGHLNGVSGMAGYVTSRGGKTYIVVSLINHVRTDYGAGEPVHAALVDWVLDRP